MTASPITLCACIPAPDQVTPSTRRRYSTPLSSLAGAQSRFSNTGTRRSFSRLTIGSTYYPKQCSATYCHYSLCTPSGMIRTSDLTQNYSNCALCKNKQTNLQQPSYATPRSLEDHLVLSHTRLSFFLVHQGGTSQTPTEQTTQARN